MTTLDSMVDADLHKLIDSVVRAHDCTDDRMLWQTLVELGLADLTGSEARGGSGASWPEAAALARAVARHGCALRVAESDLVAGWLLEQAAAPAQQSLRSAHILDDAPEVDVAEEVERIVMVGKDENGWYVSDVPADDVRSGVTGQQRHRVSDEVVEEARTRRALVGAIQISAALETISGLTIEHARTREQFGRAIGKQQAVQRMVAIVAGETALARAATDAAVLAATDPDIAGSQVAAMVAIARSCCGHAVDPVVREAHQVIGAIGTTREHRLHLFTTAALTLRSQSGATRDWDAEVLDLAIRAQPLSDLDLTPSNT